MNSRQLPGRFRVAFSFAGEQRDLVRSIVEAVEQKSGEGTVFFDEWFEYYIAGDDADLRLQDIYGKRSSLVVVCVSAQYGGKPWTQAEHRAIRALQMRQDPAAPGDRSLRILPVRVGDGDIPGVFENTICPDLRERGVPASAQLILERLALVEKDPPGTTPPSLGVVSNPVPCPDQLPGEVINQFSDRLGEDWRALANCVDLRDSEQRRIHAADPGFEGREIWHWLKRRGQLGKLAPACRAIGREDLARLVEGRDRPK